MIPFRIPVRGPVTPAAVDLEGLSAGELQRLIRRHPIGSPAFERILSAIVDAEARELESAINCRPDDGGVTIEEARRFLDVTHSAVRTWVLKGQVAARKRALAGGTFQWEIPVAVVKQLRAARS